MESRLRAIPIGLLASSIATILLLGQPAMAAKLYKWTDENGTVHFSQLPPPKNVAHKTEKLNVNAPSVKPRKLGRDLYCGDSRLPSVDRSPELNIKVLKDTIVNAEVAMQRVSDRRSEFVQTPGLDQRAARTADTLPNV